MLWAVQWEPGSGDPVTTVDVANDDPDAVAAHRITSYAFPSVMSSLTNKESIDKLLLNTIPARHPLEYLTHHLATRQTFLSIGNNRASVFIADVLICWSQTTGAIALDL